MSDPYPEIPEQYARHLRLAALESAVIEAAIRFRRAETGVWVQGETGTAKTIAAAKTERSSAFLALWVVVDDLIAARKGLYD